MENNNKSICQKYFAQLWRDYSWTLCDTSTADRCHAQQNILSSRDFRLHCGCATANSPRSLRLPVQRSIYRSMTTSAGQRWRYIEYWLPKNTKMDIYFMFSYLSMRYGYKRYFMQIFINSVDSLNSPVYSAPSCNALARLFWHASCNLHAWWVSYTQIMVITMHGDYSEYSEVVAQAKRWRYQTVVSLVATVVSSAATW